MTDATNAMHIKATESKPQSAGKRTLRFIASDETPDRMGDVIQVSGWNLASYKKNPVVLWGHDSSGVPPIGRATNVRRGRKPNGEPALYANIEFAPEEAHPFAETVYQLAKRGFLNAVSVGFLPRKTQEASEQEKQALGMPSYGQIYSEADLLEISVVSVPANPSALVSQARSLVTDNIVGKGQVERFLEHVEQQQASIGEQLQAQIRGCIDLDALDKAEAGTLKVGDMVGWDSSGGPARGKIERIATSGSIEVPDSDFTINASEDNPAALIRVYRGEDPTDTRVGHRFSALTKVRSDAPMTQKSPACRQDGETQEACVERKIPELVEEGMDQDQAVAVANSLCEDACSEKAAFSFEQKHIMAVTEGEDTYTVVYSKMGEGTASVDPAETRMGHDEEEDEEEKGEGYDEDDEEKGSDKKKPRKSLDDARMAALLEAQAEQARALTTLTDTISDLTKRLDIHGGGARGGVQPDAPAPAPSRADVEEQVEARLRQVTDAFLNQLSKRK